MPLTVFQSIPLDGVVVVSTPQDLVGMIVRKAVNMANMMNIPVLGLVENMSYALCPDCGKRIELFGKSKIAQEAAALHLPVLAQLPFDPKAAQLCDEGNIEAVENPLMGGRRACRRRTGGFIIRISKAFRLFSKTECFFYSSMI